LLSCPLALSSKWLEVAVFIIMVLLENFGGLVIQHIELLKLVPLSRPLISAFSYNYSKALNSLFRASVANHIQMHDFLFTFTDL
jgi:hypothetical protein